MRFAAAEVDAAFEIPRGVNEREAHGSPPVAVNACGNGEAARLEQPAVEPFHALAYVHFGCPACGGFEFARIGNVVALVAAAPGLEAHLRLSRHAMRRSGPAVPAG